MVMRTIHTVTDPNDVIWQALITWDEAPNGWIPVDSIIEKSCSLKQMAQAIQEGE